MSTLKVVILGLLILGLALGEETGELEDDKGDFANGETPVDTEPDEKTATIEEINQLKPNESENNATASDDGTEESHPTLIEVDSEDEWKDEVHGKCSGPIQRWKRAVSSTYHRDDRYLNVSVLLAIRRGSSIQCYLTCQTYGGCKSVNYDTANGICELIAFDVHTQSDVLGISPEDLLIERPGWIHYEENAFYPENQGLRENPCFNGPCMEPGAVCLPEPESASYYCTECPQGMSGLACQIPVTQANPVSWSSWNPCSVSCGFGLEIRTRGKEADWRPCYINDCPVWSEFSDWLPVEDSNVNCDLHEETRDRQCTNEGTANTDQGCMGMIRESKLIRNPPCDAALTLNGGSIGAGILEMELDREFLPTGHRSKRDTEVSGLLPVCATGFNTRAGDIACKQMFFAGVSTFAAEESVWTGSGFAVKVTCEDAEVTTLANCTTAWNQCDTDRRVTLTCKVDGGWSDWSAWGQCSVSCEGGRRPRTRTCSEPASANGGATCPGAADDYKDCWEGDCPVDGTFTFWSEWTACTKACGLPPGESERVRECVGMAHGGHACTGSTKDTRECNTFECPVNAYWDIWQTWSSCTTSCGGGERTRDRDCVPAQHGGNTCDPPDAGTETETCGENECPINAVLGSWSEYGSCNVTCGGSTKVRTRNCDVSPAQFGGVECENLGEPLEQYEACNEHSCAVDGAWLDWSEWGECSVTCGPGTATRDRTCQTPVHGGSWCAIPGELGEHQTQTDTRDCNPKPCPINCVWEEWTEWGACSTTCSEGLRGRTRGHEIIAQHDGVECDGSADETEQCNERPCPVNGEWDPWSAWTSCTLTCGGGTVYRIRDCGGTAHGGSSCDGDADQTIPCPNPDPCPVNCVIDEWNAWAACPGTCGGHTQDRTRDVIQQAAHGGQECPEQSQTQDCGMIPCPIDCVMEEWTEWSDCSATCDQASRDRHRGIIVDAKYDGNRCEATSQTETCPFIDCPIDCEVSEWADWTECTEVCGTGLTRRMREIGVDVKYGGGVCPHLEEELDCNTDPCPIDCEVGEWTDWAECPATCGGNKQDRSREISVAVAHGGEECPHLWEDQDCGMTPCPINCVVTEWSAWSQCTATCGNATHEAEREIQVQAEHDGDECEALVRVESCEYIECAGIWQEWGSWGTCSQTCNGGIRTKERECDQTEPPYTAECQGEDVYPQDCHELISCDIKYESCNDTFALGLLEKSLVQFRFGSSDFEAYCDPDKQEMTFPVSDRKYDGAFNPGGLVTQVSDSEGQGEKQIDLFYGGLDPADAAVLIAPYHKCVQSVEWECHNALFNERSKDNAYVTSYLRDAYGNVMPFFGFLPTEEERQRDNLIHITPYSSTTSDLNMNGQHCACFMDNTCARIPGTSETYTCNCDANDNVTRSDGGELVQFGGNPWPEYVLPLGQAAYGDTGNTYEYGTSYVGNLKCYNYPSAEPPEWDETD